MSWQLFNSPGYFSSGGVADVRDICLYKLELFYLYKVINLSVHENECCVFLVEGKASIDLVVLYMGAVSVKFRSSFSAQVYQLRSKFIS